MNKHLDNLDLLKFIAILMVLALHVPLFDYNFMPSYAPTKILQYFARLLSEGVPIFLLVNGYLLFRKEDLDLNKHVKKILKLFLILFVWVSITIVLAKKQEGVLEYLTFKDVLIELFQTTKYSEYTSHFWFIQALIAIYFIYPILFNAYKNDFKVFKYIFIVISIFTLGIDTLRLLRDFLETNGNDIWVFSNFLWFTDTVNIFTNTWSLFYFCLGGMLLHYEETIKINKGKYILIGALGALLAFGYGYVMSIKTGSPYDVTFNYGSIFMTMSLIGIYTICLSYKNKNNIINKIIQSIAKNTFGIYLFNKIVIYYLNGYLNISRFLIYILAVIICYILCLIINKIPGLRKLITL